MDRCLDKFRSYPTPLYCYDREYCTDASAPTLVSDEPFDSHDVDDSPKEKRVRTNCDPAPSNCDDPVISDYCCHRFDVFFIVNCHCRETISLLPKKCMSRSTLSITS